MIAGAASARHAEAEVGGSSASTPSGANARSAGFKAQAWHASEDTDGDNGRIEVRRTWACDELSWFAHHAALNLAALRRVRARRGRRGEQRASGISATRPRTGR